MNKVKDAARFTAPFTVPAVLFLALHFFGPQPEVVQVLPISAQTASDQMTHSPDLAGVPVYGPVVVTNSSVECWSDSGAMRLMPTSLMREFRFKGIVQDASGACGVTRSAILVEVESFCMRLNCRGATRSYLYSGTQEEFDAQMAAALAESGLGTPPVSA